MPARVVTFSVQIGTEGNAIARAVASQLGYAYLDREVVARAANVAGVSPETVVNAERWPSFLERMLESLGRASAISDSIPGSPVATPLVLSMTSGDYRTLIEQVVTELAARGDCVIVGHAGQAILREQSDVFKVLVHGSPDRRAERLAMDAKTSVEEAQELVKDTDSQRQEFFKHVYNVEWLDSSLYDLTINTDEVDVDAAVASVMTAMGSSE
jgi:cytidylate kinase